MNDVAEGSKAAFSPEDLLSSLQKGGYLAAVIDDLGGDGIPVEGSPEDSINSRSVEPLLNRWKARSSMKPGRVLLDWLSRGSRTPDWRVALRLLVDALSHLSISPALAGDLRRIIETPAEEDVERSFGPQARKMFCLRFELEAIDEWLRAWAAFEDSLKARLDALCSQSRSDRSSASTALVAGSGEWSVIDCVDAIGQLHAFVGETLAQLERDWKTLADWAEFSGIERAVLALDWKQEPARRLAPSTLGAFQDRLAEQLAVSERSFEERSNLIDLFERLESHLPERDRALLQSEHALLINLEESGEIGQVETTAPQLFKVRCFLQSPSDEDLLEEIGANFSYQLVRKLLSGDFSADPPVSFEAATDRATDGAHLDLPKKREIDPGTEEADDCEPSANLAIETPESRTSTEVHSENGQAPHSRARDRGRNTGSTNDSVAAQRGPAAIALATQEQRTGTMHEGSCESSVTAAGIDGSVTESHHNGASIDQPVEVAPSQDSVRIEQAIGARSGECEADVNRSDLSRTGAVATEAIPRSDHLEVEPTPATDVRGHDQVERTMDACEGGPRKANTTAVTVETTPRLVEVDTIPPLDKAATVEEPEEISSEGSIGRHGIVPAASPGDQTPLALGKLEESDLRGLMRRYVEGSDSLTPDEAFEVACELQVRWLFRGCNLRACALARYCETEEELYQRQVDPSRSSLIPSWLCWTAILLSDPKVGMQPESYGEVVEHCNKLRFAVDRERIFMLFWLARGLVAADTSQAMRICESLDPALLEKTSLGQSPFLHFCLHRLIIPGCRGSQPDFRLGEDVESLDQKFKERLEHAASRVASHRAASYRKMFVKRFFQRLVGKDGPVAPLLEGARTGRFPRTCPTAEEMASQLDDWRDICGSYRTNIVSRLEAFREAFMESAKIHEILRRRRKQEKNELTEKEIQSAIRAGKHLIPELEEKRIPVLYPAVQIVECLENHLPQETL